MNKANCWGGESVDAGGEEVLALFILNERRILIWKKEHKTEL